MIDWRKNDFYEEMNVFLSHEKHHLRNLSFIFRQILGIRLEITENIHHVCSPNVSWFLHCQKLTCAITVLNVRNKRCKQLSLVYISEMCLLMKMDAKRLLFEMASLPILPLGINFSSPINRKIMIPIQVFFFASYIFNVGSIALNASSSPINPMTFFFLHWVLENILNFVFLFCQRRKIRELMMKMIRNMPQHVIESQSRRSFGCIIGATCIIPLMNVLNFRHLNWTTFFEVVSSLHSTLTMTWHLPFVILSITFYFLQYDILNTFLSHVIQCLEKFIERQKTVNFSRLYTVILALLDIKEAFDDNMCVFPFIWFSTTFFTGVNTVFFTKKNKPNNSLDWINLFVLPAGLNSVLFIVVWIIDNSYIRQQRSIERVNSMLVMKKSSDDVVLRLSTIFALESLGNKKMTALRLVNLDRQFLLAYTSAFVTFNALFISLVD